MRSPSTIPISSAISVRSATAFPNPSQPLGPSISNRQSLLSDPAPTCTSRCGVNFYLNRRVGEVTAATRGIRETTSTLQNTIFDRTRNSSDDRAAPPNLA